MSERDDVLYVNRLVWLCGTWNANIKLMYYSLVGHQFELEIVSAGQGQSMEIEVEMEVGFPRGEEIGKWGVVAIAMFPAQS